MYNNIIGRTELLLLFIVAIIRRNFVQVNEIDHRHRTMLEIVINSPYKNHIFRALLDKVEQCNNCIFHIPLKGDDLYRNYRSPYLRSIETRIVRQSRRPRSDNITNNAEFDPRIPDGEQR